MDKEIWVILLGFTLVTNYVDFLILIKDRLLIMEYIVLNVYRLGNNRQASIM